MGLFFNRKNKEPQPVIDQGELFVPAPGSPGARYLPWSIEQLRAASGPAIFQTDELIHAAEQEMEFARLQFGSEQVATLEQTISEARQKMSQVYQCQQLLDDDIPDTPQQIHSWNVQILTLTDEIKASIKSREDEINRLHSLESDIDRTLSVLETRFSSMRSQLGRVETTLQSISAKYSPSATLRASGDVEQVHQTLDFADASLKRAHTALNGGNRSQAVVEARPLEELSTKVQALLESVQRTFTQIAEADATLNRSLADARADVAQARAMQAAASNPTSAAELNAATAALEEIIRSVESERDRGLYDPLDLTERLSLARERAGSRIYELSSARQAEVMLSGEVDRALTRAQTGIDSAQSFIDTRRGAVSARARTRLSEAMRTFDYALTQRQSNPQAALENAQRSANLAEDAMSAAQQDMDRYSQPAYGGYGNRGGSGMDTFGAVLGGMFLGGVIDDVFDGGGFDF